MLGVPGFAALGATRRLLGLFITGHELRHAMSHDTVSARCQRIVAGKDGGWQAVAIDEDFERFDGFLCNIAVEVDGNAHFTGCYLPPFGKLAQHAFGGGAKARGPAVAGAGRAWAIEPFLQAAAETLTADLNEAKLGGRINLDGRRVVGKAFLQLRHQTAALALSLEIDEVDDDGATDPAKTELPGNLGSGFVVCSMTMLPPLGRSTLG